MKSPAAAPSRAVPTREPTPDLLHRQPPVGLGGAALAPVLAALVLGIVALIIAMNIGHAADFGAGRSHRSGAVELHVRAAGTIVSRKCGGGRFHREGRRRLARANRQIRGVDRAERLSRQLAHRRRRVPSAPATRLNNGKSVAHGAYFYSEKDGHQGAVKMPDVHQTAPNVVTARGDKFDVTLRIHPDDVTLLARNSTDYTAPYYLVLDSASVTDVTAGNGERLAVPVAKNIGDPVDPKWDQTTWIAGRSRLNITVKTPKA